MNDPHVQRTPLGEQHVEARDPLADDFSENFEAACRGLIDAVDPGVHPEHFDCGGETAQVTMTVFHVQ